MWEKLRVLAHGDDRARRHRHRRRRRTGSLRHRRGRDPVRLHLAGPGDRGRPARVQVDVHHLPRQRHRRRQQVRLRQVRPGLDDRRRHPQQGRLAGLPRRVLRSGELPGVRDRRRGHPDPARRPPSTRRSAARSRRASTNFRIGWERYWIAPTGRRPVRLPVRLVLQAVRRVRRRPSRPPTRPRRTSRPGSTPASRPRHRQRLESTGRSRFLQAGPTLTRTIRGRGAMTYLFGRGASRAVPYGLLLPGLLLYLLFALGPSLATVVYSLTDTNGLTPAAAELHRPRQLPGVPVPGRRRRGRTSRRCCGRSLFCVAGHGRSSSSRPAGGACSSTSGSAGRAGSGRCSSCRSSSA